MHVWNQKFLDSVYLAKGFFLYLGGPTQDVYLSLLGKRCLQKRGQRYRLEQID